MVKKTDREIYLSQLLVDVWGNMIIVKEWISDFLKSKCFHSSSLPPLIYDFKKQILFCHLTCFLAISTQNTAIEKILSVFIPLGDFEIVLLEILWFRLWNWLIRLLEIQRFWLWNWLIRICNQDNCRWTLENYENKPKKLLIIKKSKIRWQLI